jgi:hypothetical protein
MKNLLGDVSFYEKILARINNTDEFTEDLPKGVSQDEGTR